ncbi:hypothetical protein M406DRAFT_321247, partial [Cryphonectria parasitica EP155]
TLYEISCFFDVLLEISKSCELNPAAERSWAEQLDLELLRRQHLLGSRKGENSYKSSLDLTC